MCFFVIFHAEKLIFARKKCIFAPKKCDFRGDDGCLLTGCDVQNVKCCIVVQQKTQTVPPGVYGQYYLKIILKNNSRV